MSGALVFAGIAPHPPLLVPEVGGSRIEEVGNSRRALREFSQRLVATRPDTVVVISPHSPLDPQYFTARASDELAGDFREFNAREVKMAFNNDLQLIEYVKKAAIGEGVELRELHRGYALDHGAMVPLYYLHEAGWRGPLVVVGFTNNHVDAHLAFGRAIEKAARASGRRVAVVASADLSHRLVPGGPYEFEPTAHFFDEQIVQSITSGDARGITEVDQALRARAGECGYRSIVVALGSVGENMRDHQVLSYEGPFGVGYLVGVLYDENNY
jgi:aromatic ring-opening dioxygenase LigB subunit